MADDKQMRVPLVKQQAAADLVPYLEEKFPGVGWGWASAYRFCATQGMRAIAKERADLEAEAAYRASKLSHCPDCGEPEIQDNRDVLLSWLKCPNGHSWDNPRFPTALM